MSKSENRSDVDRCFARLMEDLSFTPAELASLQPGEDGRINLGRAALQIMVDELGGLTVHMPSMKTLQNEHRATQMLNARRAGFTYAQIARTFGLDISHVRRIIQEGGDGI